MDELGGLVYSIDKRLSSVLPTLSSAATSSSRSTSSDMQNTPVNVKEPDVHPSQFFYGNPNHFGGFMLQCNLAFNRAPATYATDASRITYIITALQGRALQWSHAYFNSRSVNNYSFPVFLSDSQKVFEQPLLQETAT